MNLGRQQKQFLDILISAKLKDGIGWVSKMHFYRIVPAITQPGARRDELQKKGYVIESKKINPDQNWTYYRLVSEPQKLPPAFTPQPIRQVSLPSI